VAVVLTLVPTKQIRINIHKRNNTKTQYIQVHILPKHPHIHPHITKPTHTNTHTLQNPHIHTPTYYKTFQVHSTHIYLPMKMEQSVPKRRHINSRRRELPKRKHTSYRNHSTRYTPNKIVTIHSITHSNFLCFKTMKLRYQPAKFSFPLSPHKSYLSLY